MTVRKPRRSLQSMLKASGATRPPPRAVQYRFSRLPPLDHAWNSILMPSAQPRYLQHLCCHHHQWTLNFHQTHSFQLICDPLCHLLTRLFPCHHHLSFLSMFQYTEASKSGHAVCTPVTCLLAFVRWTHQSSANTTPKMSSLTLCLVFHSFVQPTIKITRPGLTASMFRLSQKSFVLMNVLDATWMAYGRVFCLSAAMCWARRARRSLLD
jgi:hypothetical protein